MLAIHYSEVEFTNTDIKIVNGPSKEILIRFKDVYAMAYKKPSFLNFIRSSYTWFVMGILFIAPKNFKGKREDLIRIIIPYKELIKIPKKWFDKIEFYNVWNSRNTIDRMLESEFINKWWR